MPICHLNGHNCAYPNGHKGHSDRNRQYQFHFIVLEMVLTVLFVIEMVTLPIRGISKHNITTLHYIIITLCLLNGRSVVMVSPIAALIAISNGIQIRRWVDH